MIRTVKRALSASEAAAAARARGSFVEDGVVDEDISVGGLIGGQCVCVCVCGLVGAFLEVFGSAWREVSCGRCPVGSNWVEAGCVEGSTCVLEAVVCFRGERG